MPADSSSASPTDSTADSKSAVPKSSAFTNVVEPDSESPVSSDRGGTVAVPRTQIDWYRSTPWWRLISQSVHISWRSSHLLVCGLALALSALTWNICLICFAPSISAVPIGIEDQVVTVWNVLYEPDPIKVFSTQTSPPSFGPNLVPSLDKALDVLFLNRPWTIRKLAFFVIFTLALVAIWGFAGGLIARRSIMEFGVRTSVGWMPTVKLVASRWRSILWSMMMPLSSIAMLALIPMALGVVARMGSVGQTIALLATFPCLLVMLGIGWIAAIASLGFSISVCAIVAEKGADAFDGLSRAAAYVFQRPMTMLCILIVGVGVGSVGYWVFDFVLDCGERIFMAAMSVGYGGAIWEGFMASESSGRSGLPGNLFRSLIATLAGLRYAYLISFFWTASAAAYLILRREIDHTDFDDLDLQELGEPVPIPKLTEDTTESTEPATP